MKLGTNSTTLYSVWFSVQYCGMWNNSMAASRNT